MVGTEKIAALRDELGDRATEVRFADMLDVGANPARIIPAWRAFVDEHGGEGRPVRGIGEPIWAGRSADEMTECERHEALLNLAFVDAPGVAAALPVRHADPAVVGARRSSPQPPIRARRRRAPSHRGVPWPR